MYIILVNNDEKEGFHEQLLSSQSSLLSLLHIHVQGVTAYSTTTKFTFVVSTSQTELPSLITMAVSVV